MVLANFELFVFVFFVDNFILIIDISFHSRIPHIITILIAERRPRFILVSCISYTNLFHKDTSSPLYFIVLFGVTKEGSGTR